MASERMMDSQKQGESTGPGPATAESPALPELDLGSDDQAVEAALAQVQCSFDAWLRTHERAQAEWQGLDQRREERTQSDGDLTDREVSLQSRAAQLDEQAADLEARQAAFEAAVQERQSALDARAAEVEEADERLTEPAQPEPAPDAEPQAGTDSHPSTDDAFTEDVVSSGPATVASPPEVAGPEAESAEPAEQVAEHAADPASEIVHQTEPTDNRSSASDEAAAQTPSPSKPDTAEAASEDHEQREPKPEEAPGPALDLDPATAQKLRVLRRLQGPGKSDADLLAQIEARGRADPVKVGGKKHWWKRGS